MRVTLHDHDQDLICCYRKTEVMNLLESAGFSRANPYYVVQQGKVSCEQHTQALHCCIDQKHIPLPRQRKGAC